MRPPARVRREEWRRPHRPDIGRLEEVRDDPVAPRLVKRGRRDGGSERLCEESRPGIGPRGVVRAERQPDPSGSTRDRRTRRRRRSTRPTPGCAALRASGRSPGVAWSGSARRALGSLLLRPQEQDSPGGSRRPSAAWGIGRTRAVSTSCVKRSDRRNGPPPTQHDACPEDRLARRSRRGSNRGIVFP